jgi:hypothetical protein
MAQMTKIPKPVNNAIVISDKKSAEWLAKQVNKPLTAKRISDTKKNLLSTYELFFKK